MQAENNPLNLTYTQEMEEQDKLWENEAEDLEIMEELQIDIIAQAKRNGWDGYFITFDWGNEVITEVYDSLEEFKDVQLGKVEVEDNIAGNCRGVIWLLNKHYTYLQKEKGN